MNINQNSRTTQNPLAFNTTARSAHVGEVVSAQSRFIAYTLDGLIFGFSFGIGWLIWFLMLSQKSTTPGHYLLGHTIVDAESGENLSVGKLVVRELLLKGVLQWILGSFLFLMNYAIDGAFLLTSKKRTVHDMIIGSQVIMSGEKALITL